MVWSWLGLCGCLFVCAYPSIGMALAHPIQFEAADSTRRSPHAVYTVSSLLRPDGTVQTTSQVTLDQFPSFINGNEVQLFVQTHGMVHLRNVQSHSSSRTAYAMQDRPTHMRSRSSVPCQSRVGLTPAPHGKSEDDDDWGEWTHSGRRTTLITVSPTRMPCFSRTDQPTHTVDLIQLRVRAPAPSLGSHHFVLRTGSQVEEIAIRINDVLRYTLPCLAELVYPDPSKSKQSWDLSRN